MLTLINKLRFGNPWKYKAPLLICWPYIMILLTGIKPLEAVYFILLAYSTLFGIASLGYFINDWSDINSDKKASKSNKMGELNLGFKILILLILLSFSFVPWIWLPKNQYTYILLGAEILLFLLYSLPPFRLKEKGVLGILTDSLYAYIVPSMLAGLTFYLVGRGNYIDFEFFVLAISTWLLVVGIRGILLHQLLDYKNDLNAGVKTFVTIKGTSMAERIITALLPVELILLTGFFVFVMNEFWLLFPGYLFYCLFQLLMARKNKEIVNFKEYQKFSYRFLDDFYLDFLPVLILAQLCIANYYYAPLLFLHIIFFRSFIKNILSKFIPR